MKKGSEGRGRERKNEGSKEGSERIKSSPKDHFIPYHVAGQERDGRES